MQMSFESI